MTVLEICESKSRSDHGIVRHRSLLRNQKRETERRQAVVGMSSSELFQTSASDALDAGGPSAGTRIYTS
jgi:hypothetical protein